MIDLFIIVTIVLMVPPPGPTVVLRTSILSHSVGPSQAKAARVLHSMSSLGASNPFC